MMTLPPLPTPTDSMNFMTAENFDLPGPDNFQAAPMGEMEFRNLKFDRLSGGKVAAQIVRAMGPLTENVSVWHMHHLDFHLGYIIKGWIAYEFERLGEVRLEAGAGIFHLPRSRMRVIDRSPDFEGIWIKTPAEDEVSLFIFDEDDREYNEVNFVNSMDQE
jgi:hypothetical protein